MSDLFKVIYNATGSCGYKMLSAEETIPEGYKEQFKGTKEACLQYISANQSKSIAPFEFGSKKINTHNVTVFTKFTI